MASNSQEGVWFRIKYPALRPVVAGDLAAFTGRQPRPAFLVLSRSRTHIRGYRTEGSPGFLCPSLRKAGNDREDQVPAEVWRKRCDQPSGTGGNGGEFECEHWKSPSSNADSLGSGGFQPTFRNQENSFGTVLVVGDASAGLRSRAFVSGPAIAGGFLLPPRPQAAQALRPGANEIGG